MRRAYLLVEGETDAAFLRKVLAPDAQKDVEVVPAGGAAAIPSLARSLLVRRGVPVAVFADSDSLNPAVIRERQQSLQGLIEMVAASVPVKVVLAVPEMEVCFFVSPEVIEKVLGRKVPPELISLGRRDPRGILDYLATGGKRKWDTRQAIQEMDGSDIERIRAAPPIQELTKFLQGLPQLVPTGS
jgi:hypothetical protein